MSTDFLHTLSLAYTHSQDNASISGQLLMLDDKTPHVACVVQVVRHSRVDCPPVVSTTLSDEDGCYQFTHLTPGAYQVRCYTTNGYIYYREGEAWQVGHSGALENIDFRFALSKKGHGKRIPTLTDWHRIGCGQSTRTRRD